MAFSTRTKAKQKSPKQLQTLIQTPADLDVDANDLIIVPAKPEKPDQRFLTLLTQFVKSNEHQM
jgi:hypothetical protein